MSSSSAFSPFVMAELDAIIQEHETKSTNLIQHTELPSTIYIEHDKNKGRILKTTQDWNIGSCLFKDQPLIYSNGYAHLCIQCDTPHASTTCSYVHSSYPQHLIKHLPNIEDTLCEMDAIGELDRARCWIKCMNIWSAYLQQAKKKEIARKKKQKQKDKKKLASASTTSTSTSTSTITTTPSTTTDEKSSNESKEGSKELDMGPLTPIFTLTGTQLSSSRSCITSMLQSPLLSQLIPPSHHTHPQIIDKLALLLSILNTNSHELPDFGGCALYPYAAMMEHSCLPNCTFSTYGTELSIHAVTPIKSGNSLSIDYEDGEYYRCTKTRQETLHEIHEFICVCQACTVLPDKTRAFVCEYKCDDQCEPKLEEVGIARTTGGYGVMYPIGDGTDLTKWICSSCSRSPSPTYIQTCLTTETTHIEHPPSTLDELEQILTQHILHVSHHALFWPLHDMGRQLCDEKKGEEAEKVWVRVISCIERVLPPYHNEKIITYDQLGQIRVLAGRIVDDIYRYTPRRRIHECECHAMSSRDRFDSCCCVHVDSFFYSIVQSAGAAWRRAHSISCIVNGSSSYHTEQLLELSRSPPKNVDELVQHYARVKQDMYGEEEQEDGDDHDEEEDEDDD